MPAGWSVITWSWSLGGSAAASCSAATVLGSVPMLGNVANAVFGGLLVAVGGRPMDAGRRGVSGPIPFLCAAQRRLRLSQIDGGGLWIGPHWLTNTFSDLARPRGRGRCPTGGGLTRRFGHHFLTVRCDPDHVNVDDR